MKKAKNEDRGVVSQNSDGNINTGKRMKQATVNLLNEQF